MKKYADFYKTGFGRKILEKELELVLVELGRSKRILSIGCGPGFLETGLMQISGAKVTGLDSSKEMLQQAPKELLTVLGSAEKMDFADREFDAVLFVTSLEFVDDYKKAVLESARILKPKGRVLILMLNPESDYFKEHMQKGDSYFKKVRHKNLNEIKKVVAKYFSIEERYFLGIKGEEVFSSSDKKTASLFVMSGEKK